MVTVTWTDGENVEAHGVVLFNPDFSLTRHIAPGMNGSHTFSNVDAGSYVAVVVALNADGTLLTDANGALPVRSGEYDRHRRLTGLTND